MRDPRPRIEGDAPARLVGVACSVCEHPMPTPRPVCAACGGEVHPARFGPNGVVWASTVVRIAVGDRRPPYTLAYVDLNNGPRVLAHVSGGDEAPAVGSRVRLIPSLDGDVVVEAQP